MKKLITIIAIVFSGMLVQAQTKEEACKMMENTLEKYYPGVYVNYDYATVIITLPINAVAKRTKVTVNNLRKVYEDNKKLNDLGYGLMNAMSSEAKAFYDVGFYYMKVVFEDDYSHNYKLYSTHTMKIK